MQRQKFIAPILAGKLIAVVKGEAKRRTVRLNQHVWSKHFRTPVGMAVFQARVLMSPHVVPRPAVKAPVLYVRGVIRRQVITKPIPFVGGSPKRAGVRFNGQS